MKKLFQKIYNHVYNNKLYDGLFENQRHIETKKNILRSFLLILIITFPLIKIKNFIIIYFIMIIIYFGLYIHFSVEIEYHKKKIEKEKNDNIVKAIKEQNKTLEKIIKENGNNSYKELYKKYGPK